MPDPILPTLDQVDSGATGPPALIVGLGVAVFARAVIGRAMVAGGHGPTSVAAALAFAGVVGGVAAVAGYRATWPSLRCVSIGLVGAALLVAGPAATRAGAYPAQGSKPAMLAAWAAAAAAVGIAEEALIRGVLWAAVERSRGPVAALGATTAIFAVIHLPLYGWKALPLDLAAGVVLGGVRMWSGGPGAPALAHVIADLAGGWL